jgi:hypothetical protein
LASFGIDAENDICSLVFSPIITEDGTDIQPAALPLTPISNLAGLFIEFSISNVKMLSIPFLLSN